MAGRKTGGVVDWQWLMIQMPIGSDPLSKKNRRLLFEEMDADDNGLLHITEAVKDLFKRIRVVRGILDLGPVWKRCFQLARASVAPVIPIGIDFMEQNQFRMYLVCLWMYFRVWEYFYCNCPKGKVAVRLHDLPQVL